MMGSDAAPMSNACSHNACSLRNIRRKDWLGRWPIESLHPLQNILVPWVTWSPASSKPKSIRCSSSSESWFMIWFVGLNSLYNASPKTPRISRSALFLMVQTVGTNQQDIFFLNTQRHIVRQGNQPDAYLAVRKVVHRLFTRSGNTIHALLPLWASLDNGSMPIGLRILFNVSSAIWSSGIQAGSLTVIPGYKTSESLEAQTAVPCPCFKIKAS